MRPAGPGVKLTYADFVHFPDDGKRHELIDGEHYVTPSPNVRHQIDAASRQGDSRARDRDASKGTRRRDETIKRRLYERTGASEYWIVDPAIDVIRIYRREGAGFGRPVELSREAGDVLTTSLLPGLEMPLARIFRD